MKKDSLTVYWSALNAFPIFKDNKETNKIDQNINYHFDSSMDFIKKHNDLSKVLNYLRKDKKNFEGTFFACPATKNLFNNTYYIDYNKNLHFSLNESDKKKFFLQKEILEYIPKKNALEEIIPVRSSNLNSYFCGRLSPFYWFFADEPLEMRITAPYFPSISPSYKSIFSSGEFDIGKWFRPITLEWHFLEKTTDIRFDKNDPIVFIEFKTSKKIIFKKFKLSNKLMFLTNQCVSSPRNDGEFKTLSDRYSLSEDAGLPELIIKEINKNLI